MLQINLLDMKRSMNVNIFLKQFRLPNTDIVALVKEGKAEEINAERLKGLLKIMPERDEVSARQFFIFCHFNDLPSVALRPLC